MSIQFKKEMFPDIMNHLEGKLFLHRFVSVLNAENFSFHQHYYTLKSGIVYEVTSTGLQPTKDDPLSLTTCKDLGPINENKLPQYITPVTFTYADMVQSGLLKDKKKVQRKRPSL